MKNYLLFFSMFAFVSCNAQIAVNTKPEESLDAFIRREADSIFNSSKIPGLFIGVLENGKRTYYNFGYADPATKAPFDSATIFEIGSITKTFTAFILSMVLHDHKIKENTSIISYLPDSVSENKALEQITFLKLLNHTSGLPRIPGNINIGSAQPYQDYDVNALFSYLKKATPKTDGIVSYSNLGYGLAGTLAERISGKDYNTLISVYIHLPFKMTSSIVEDVLADDTRKYAKGYMEDKPVEFWEFDALGGAGRLQYPASKMLSYLGGMSNPPIFKYVVDKLLDPTISFGPRLKIGRAWVISHSDSDNPIYWHNGGTYGFSTFAGFMKGQQKAVIVVVNKFNTNNVSDLLGIKIMERMRDSK